MPSAASTATASTSFSSPRVPIVTKANRQSLGLWDAEAAAATATTTTSSSAYTTIPISGVDAISRSFQNLSTYLSLRRPWPEFLSVASSFDRPGSLSCASLRVQRNAKYFGANYAILVTICAALSLIGAPIALIVFSSVFVLWLALYFFREDPMVVWGHHVSDSVVITGLVVVSALAVWFTGFINNVLIGAAVGLSASAIHGVLRNPEELFLDEDDAVSNGLIGPGRLN